MNGFSSKHTGWLALLVGAVAILAVITLALFFVGLFQNMRSLLPLGVLNDKLNALAGILGALLASALYPTLQRLTPRLNAGGLIGAWVGAIAITYGSWLILTGRGGLELSSYYFFFGNGLIGIWLWILNRNAWQQAEAIIPSSLTRLGVIAGSFMMVGWLGLYGILLGLDGSDYSPLLSVAGISFLGTGIFYPIWCLLLGRWILSNSLHE
jgi:uncharacterized membrane protein YeaQ/YmgE (transglycosylase-associated protein family)